MLRSSTGERVHWPKTCQQLLSSFVGSSYLCGGMLAITQVENLIGGQRLLILDRPASGGEAEGRCVDNGLSVKSCELVILIRRVSNERAATDLWTESEGCAGWSVHNGNRCRSTSAGQTLDLELNVFSSLYRKGVQCSPVLLHAPTYVQEQYAARTVECNQSVVRLGQRSIAA